MSTLSVVTLKLRVPKVTSTALAMSPPRDRSSVNRGMMLYDVFAVCDLDGSLSVSREELLAIGKMRRTAGHKSSRWDEERHVYIYLYIYICVYIYVYT